MLSPEQRHECQFVEPVLGAVRLVRPGGRGGRPRTKPRLIAGDKGYSFSTVRRYLRHREIRAVIPACRPGHQRM